MKQNEILFRTEFWLRVHACFIRFHKLSESEASAMVQDLLKKLPIRSEEPDVDLIYHLEPFRFACKVTGHRLSVKEFATEYQELLSQIRSSHYERVPGTTVTKAITDALQDLLQSSSDEGVESTKSAGRLVMERKRKYSKSSKKKGRTEALPPAAAASKKKSPKKANFSTKPAR